MNSGNALTAWISAIVIILVVAYLVAPHSQASAVLKALGTASSQNIRALAGGVGEGTATPSYNYGIQGA